MAVLSSMPSPGPTLPANCTNVKVRQMGADPSAGNNKIDVTTLNDLERVYEKAPLIDPGPGADEGVTKMVTASFFGEPPALSSEDATGWVCIEVETEYAVGEFVKGTATYVYKTPEGS